MVNENIKKNGMKTALGTYVLEGSVSYIEQGENEEETVNVVTVDGIFEKVPINKLEVFIEDTDSLHNDVKRELRILISKILNG